VTMLQTRSACLLLAAMPCPVSFVEYSGHWSAATKFGLTCHSENTAICEHIGSTMYDEKYEACKRHPA
jgi:hypothetical protein